MENMPVQGETGFIHIDRKYYAYEYRKARHEIDFCLATKDPQKYCNGHYLYSRKNPGNGLAFVITFTTNKELMTKILERNPAYHANAKPND